MGMEDLEVFSENAPALPKKRKHKAASKLVE